MGFLFKINAGIEPGNFLDTVQKLNQPWIRIRNVRCDINDIIVVLLIETKAQCVIPLIGFVWHFDDLIFFVTVVVAVALPLDLFIVEFLVWKYKDFHAAGIKRVAFVHIDEVELELAFVFAFDAEIKPSCVAFGVDVVLQDEV